MAADVLLPDVLADALPKDVELRVYHLSTRPENVPALYSTAQDHAEQKTECESQFLSLALTPNDRPQELMIFAIEVLIFTTNSLTTLFVSKADSTGFLDILPPDKSRTSIIKTITGAFLRFLIRARSPGPRLVLSLFARSQNQYLFPGSVEYAGKHVLDDRQLIKWWCKTLDPIIRDPSLGVTGSNIDTAAYVLVPGCDRSETRAFFPISARQDTPQGMKWRASYPMELLVPDRSAPLRCLIPRLPDDPKSRFLTDLDDSQVEKGQWRSVKTMDQFWEMMSYRQECSAGRLVGFIWVVFGDQDVSRDKIQPSGNVRPAQEPEIGEDGAALSTPFPSQTVSNGVKIISEITASDLEEITLPQSPPPSSPVLPPHEPNTRDAGNGDGQNSNYHHYNNSRTRETKWPEQTRGELIVSSEQYDILIEYLLQLDFSTRTDAETGTSSFITKTAELAGGSSWGKSIRGRNVSLEGAEPTASAVEKGVNVLMGVRKKRKADGAEEPSPAPKPSVNTLSAGLVRKKAKT